MISEEKQRLRKQMKSSLREMSSQERARQSAALVAALQQEPRFRAAQRIFAFFPLPSEPFLLPAIFPQQKLFLPRTTTAGLVFHRIVDLHLSLRRSALGVLEPCSDLPIALPRQPREADILLVPGLAFSSQGERLGRGGGFYDRFLGSLAADFSARWGVCFACQLRDSLPMASFDQKVDRVFLPDLSLLE